MELPFTSTQERMDMLKNCVFLQGLQDRVLDELASRAEMLWVAGGKAIINQDEIGSRMYFIISGNARVHHGEVTLANIGSGDVFGEMAVLDSEKRSASVMTESDSVLLSIERDVFYEAL